MELKLRLTLQQFDTGSKVYRGYLGVIKIVCMYISVYNKEGLLWKLYTYQCPLRNKGINSVADCCDMRNVLVNCMYDSEC